MFYHDKHKRTITKVIQPPQGRQTKSGGWKVHAHYWVHSYEKDEAGSLTFTEDGVSPIETYMSRDDEANALKYFRMNHSPTGEKIDYEQYRKLLESIGATK